MSMSDPALTISMRVKWQFDDLFYEGTLIGFAGISAQTNRAYGVILMDDGGFKVWDVSQLTSVDCSPSPASIDAGEVSG